MTLSFLSRVHEHRTRFTLRLLFQIRFAKLYKTSLFNTQSSGYTGRFQVTTVPVETRMLRANGDSVMQSAPFLCQSLARSFFTEHANPTGLF